MEIADVDAGTLWCPHHVGQPGAYFSPAPLAYPRPKVGAKHEDAQVLWSALNIVIPIGSKLSSSQIVFRDPYRPI